MPLCFILCYQRSVQGLKLFCTDYNRPLSLKTSINQGGFQWNAVRIFVTHHYVAQNTAISTQIGGTQACIKSSVNTSTHSGVNNCRYLLQHREQWRESSPQILKALSVSGTANRKSNLLCHTETCLTTLNNCTAALERAVFLLSNEGLQGKEHGTMCFISVCVCLRMCVWLYVRTGVICNVRAQGLYTYVGI